MSDHLESPGLSRGEEVNADRMLRIGMARGVSAEAEATVGRITAATGRTAEICRFANREELETCLPHIEVLYGSLRAGQAARAPRLRWVQAQSAGVDGLPLQELRAAGIVLTNARGVYDEAMAEHALALLLALVRELPDAVRAQADGVWRPLHGGDVLAGSRLGILGYGAIGRAVAARGRAFGLSVWATRAHPRPDPLVERMFGPTRAELLECLAGCGHIVATLPSTPATRGQLDQEALAVLPAGARVINVGRGDLIVEEALNTALRSGHLAGAGLDCPPRDPLPPDSPLWTAPGALITPHIGGSRPDNGIRTLQLFAANLARYCSGEPLENRVDLAAGY